MIILSVIKLSAYDRIIDSAIENEISLLLLMKASWSPLQYNIIKEYTKIGKQIEVANELGTSQAFVSRTMHKLKWKELNHIEKNLNYTLFRYQQRLIGRPEIEHPID
jgi:hypothetical protein